MDRGEQLKIFARCLGEPIYAIEETKTDDKESRNTGVYQRCSKFIFISSL